MALTKGDDFPIHQTAEPIAYSGTDRNFYDRYFFNGYHPTEGEDFFAIAFGVYPHLNVADAAFVVVRNGVETALHASRWLGGVLHDGTAVPMAGVMVACLLGSTAALHGLALPKRRSQSAG